MDFLIFFLVRLIIFGIVYWIWSMIPVPEPFKKVGFIIILIAFALFLIYFLLGLSGSDFSFGSFPHRR